MLCGAQSRRPSRPGSCRLTPSTPVRPGEVWGCCLNKDPGGSLPTATDRERGQDRWVWFSFVSVTDCAPSGTISDAAPPGLIPSGPLTLGTVTPRLAMSPAMHTLLQAHDPSIHPSLPRAWWGLACGRRSINGC